MKEKNKGITLIALVITIIVLLLLAGVTIAAVFGQDGILEKAQLAKKRTNIAQSAEEIALRNIELQTNVSALPGKGEGIVSLKKDEEGNLMPIPNGFYYVTGTKNTGFVISDDIADENKENSFIGNQFVYIPVDFMSEYTLKSWNGELVGTAAAENTYVDFGTNNLIQSIGTNQKLATLTTLPVIKYALNSGNGSGSGLEVKDTDYLKQSVEYYKGFYMGRFKASQIADNGTTIAESKKDKTAWTNFTYSSAKVAASTLYGNRQASEMGSMVNRVAKINNSTGENSIVRSHLTTGIEYDAMLKWLISTKALTEKQVTSNINPTNYPILNGLYDLAKGPTELTNEFYGSHDPKEETNTNNLIFSSRGGNILSARKQNNINANLDCTMRVCLYLKVDKEDQLSKPEGSGSGGMTDEMT